MSTTPFAGRILVLGCGSVAQCTLPLLLRHLEVPPERITVLDFVDCRKPLASYLARGVRFVRERITPENYEQELARHAGPGDLIVDLAWNIDCAALLDFCRRNDVLYINTSVEVWNPYAGAESTTPPERTLYARHLALRKMIAGWTGESRVTAILDHGANPGLVSHFTKMGLIDIARRIITETPDDPRRGGLEEALAARRFNRLAQATGVKVIHISERDTQISNKRRKGNEFVNTWSVEGFHEEGIAPAEMGWGTHERQLPHDAWQHAAGPCNQICLERFGMNTFVRSRVPSSEIVGMVIRHGEAFSISEFLTVKGARGKALYRPTVHYAYLPCEYAVASLDEIREQDYVMHEKWRIMRDEIVCGYDELGVLLMAYSMVLPYVLALYHLHLQFARSIDFDNVEAYITKIERSLDEIDKILENRVAKAGAMAASAYSDCKTLVSSMRAATTFLRELPEEGVTQGAAVERGGTVQPDALPEGPGEKSLPQDGSSLPLIT